MLYLEGDPFASCLRKLPFRIKNFSFKIIGSAVFWPHSIWSLFGFLISLSFLFCHGSPALSVFGKFMKKGRNKG